MATAAAVGALSAQERAWTVEDVMTLRSVGDVAMSPGGDWVAYVVSYRDVDENENRADLWLSGIDGGTPLRLTRQGHSNRAPSWVPDGSWIAFLSDRDGDTQVFGIRPTGGEAWRVTHAPSGVSSFAIAPSGDRIAYAAHPGKTDEDAELEEWRGRPMVWDSAYATDWTHAWVAPLRDGVAGDPERSSPEGLSVVSMVWSPDSRGLAWSAVGPADGESFGSRDRPTGLSREADVFVQDRPGATPRKLETLPGSKSVVDWVDGVGLIISGSSRGAGTYNRLLWSVDPAGSSGPVALTEGLDEHARLVDVLPDGLLVEASHRTGSRLYRIPMRSGRPTGDPEVLTDDELFYGDFSSTRGGDQVAFVANGPTTPPDVYVSGVSRFAPRRVSEVNPQLPDLAMGEQRVVRWRSHQGGEEIEGVLTLPVGYREGDRVPLLLVIHGGPSGVSANTFSPGGRYPIQVFAGLGYASLQPNYRG
ncbi:MAG TPA: hypothetical protein VJ997_11670, partial [Longimicrobiales bacterium]|nr:hypothetical protein [Longimicrobiales bacterium]